MKVFIDSNVLLDVALKREPFYKESLFVMEWCIRNASSNHIAWHTVTNCFYLLRREIGKEPTIAALSSLLEWIEIAPTSKSLAQAGLQNAGKDFEDTLQHLCAEAAGCDVIITRNTKDFQQSQVKSYTPTDFIKAFTE